jgi:acyl-CoA synthetase (AMP-forming)/AMP-acid ligase II
VSVDPGRKRERWGVRSVPPDLERAYVDGGWWTEDTLGAIVARQLATHPAATISIWSRSRGWRGTYADVDDEARRLITLLRDVGVQPGDAVAFQLPNWREALVSFAALAMGGYVVVPVVHIYGRKEVAFILEESGAAAYISPHAYGHVDYGAIVETAAPASLRLHVVVDDAEAPSSSTGLARIGWAACAQRKPAVNLPTAQPEDVAVLGYTSGTTSDPKGVIHDHRTMLSELRHMKAWVTRGCPT